MVRVTTNDGWIETHYPLSYWPGETVGEHLEFALKYDGINLGILECLFHRVQEQEIIDWIASKPMGKYARKIWFLFEFITGKVLPIENLIQGNYVDLLEQDLYYTTQPGQRAQRQRIINNLPGNRRFCPIIRRTDKLAAMEKLDLHRRCDEIVTAYPPDLIRRALNYLYNKETMSSFEIERIKPSASRSEKFIGLLMMAENRDFCEKSCLIDLQNHIVDPRFRDKAYRSNQNYVGQVISYQKKIVHYICPKPEDLHELMDGLLSAHRIMIEGGVPAVIHTAVIAYGFVFMHPFEDGNGRIHRFLIHNILSLRRAVPKGLMFPISAAMLKNPDLYDRSLESFSKPLMQKIEYDLNDLGQLTVQGETISFYRYMDMTTQAEAMYDFVQLTVEQELTEELNFIESYDRTKRQIQNIVDMPDNLIDLFIQLSLQNNGRISNNKRTSHFRFLTDKELEQMEEAVREGYRKQ
jgi:hypothetical protein